MRKAALLLVASLGCAAGIVTVAAQSYATGSTADQVYKITTAAAGSWSTTFPRPTRSSDPIVEAKAHTNAATSPNQTICNPTSVSSTGASGFCSVSQGTTATLNASVQPFAAAGSVVVDIIVKEPTS